MPTELAVPCIGSLSRLEQYVEHLFGSDIIIFPPLIRLSSIFLFSFSSPLFLVTQT